MGDKTVTVKPSGGTYTTLALAIAGELVANADLTAGGMNGILNIEIDGDWSSGADADATVNGFTTDATHYVNIYTTSAARHAGLFTTAKYRMSNDGVALWIQDNYVRVTGLQFVETGAGAGKAGIRIADIADGSSGVIIESCIIDSAASGILAYGGTVAIRNCALHGNDASSGITVDNFSAVTCTIDNCTVVNFDTGLQCSGGTANARNTYMGGCATTDATGTITYTTCASSDATARAGVTPSIAYSTSAGAYFTNVTGGSEDLHITASSSLKDAGTDLSGTFTTDIDGVTRSGTWDIGADEYVAAGGASATAASILAMADTAGLSQTLPLSVVDSVALTVGTGGSLSWAATIADAMSLTDESLTGGQIVVSVTDGIVATDTAAALSTLLLAISDGPVFEDTVGATVTYSITVADGVSLSDAISAAMAMLATVTDNMALTDAVAEGAVASGRMQITITAKGASVTITSKHPGASISGKQAGVTIS